MAKPTAQHPLGKFSKRMFITGERGAKITDTFLQNPPTMGPHIADTGLNFHPANFNGKNDRMIYPRESFVLPKPESKQAGLTLMEFHAIAGRKMNLTPRQMDGFVENFIASTLKGKLSGKTFTLLDLVSMNIEWGEKNIMPVEHINKLKNWFKLLEDNGTGKFKKTLEEYSSMTGDKISGILDSETAQRFADWHVVKEWRNKYKDTVKLDVSSLINAHMKWADKNILSFMNPYNEILRSKDKDVVLEELFENLKHLELEDYIKIMDQTLSKRQRESLEWYLIGGSKSSTHDSSGVPWGYDNLSRGIKDWKIKEAEKGSPFGPESYVRNPKEPIGLPGGPKSSDAQLEIKIEPLKSSQEETPAQITKASSWKQQFKLLIKSFWKALRRYFQPKHA
ncbi:hypothetical protein PGT21_008857 [Puccinia graminis f. sp. tritici]|uniref:Uncharacterized protein n=1 Tax=Puccinia graminis f. sp. tritici TaxID=56615 RepID=A0A5B0QEN9_PUCGR|nr:hypothetical protein PGT21_008857 [Puccinia graminis f. sp. tritici]